MQTLVLFFAFFSELKNPQNSLCLFLSGNLGKGTFDITCLTAVGQGVEKS